MDTNKIFIKTKYCADFIESFVIFPQLSNNITETTMKEIINLREEGIRKALIELGWTPPKDSA